MLFVFFCNKAGADIRSDYLTLAERGWNYQLRTTMLGRDMSIPVRINGRDMAGSSLCLVGDLPNSRSIETLDAFRGLMLGVFGKPMPMRYAGRNASQCGSGRIVVLRFYSGRPPNRAFSDDIHWISQTYLLGLPVRRGFMAAGPAMAQTFFGRRGRGTHIMVSQSSHVEPDPLERVFYRSILVEELFQSFTFGMDLLQFNPAQPFQSKLQEVPTNLRMFPWDSAEFMRGLLQSNPAGLCPFDVFMLLAIARSSVEQTTDPAFLAFIDREYDTLLQDATTTVAKPEFAPIVDADCVASVPRATRP